MTDAIEELIQEMQDHIDAKTIEINWLHRDIKNLKEWLVKTKFTKKVQGGAKNDGDK